MEGADLSFPKKYKLKGNKNITTLLNNGEAFFVFPLRVKYLHTKLTNLPLQVVISVPKKKLPLATKRNLIKRRIFEALRLHKALLNTNQSIQLFIIYTQTQVADFITIENAIIKMYNKLNKLTTNELA
jgi:ribonuclease P protein component